MGCASPDFSVRPNGADHLWGKEPPKELSVDLVASEQLGRVTGWAEASRQRPRWWPSNLAGRNASEARAGLESEVVDADPPEKRGRPERTGKQPTRTCSDPPG